MFNNNVNFDENYDLSTVTSLPEIYTVAILIGYDLSILKACG
ncbi:933_t:CDS:1, partial [Cetraspora pellucida]